MPFLCHDKLNGPSTGPHYQPPHEARLGTLGMIDNLGLAVSHGLIILAVWRLLWRPDLNDDSASPPAADEAAPKLWRGRKGA